MKPRITAEVWLGRCNIKHGQYSYVFPSDLSANSKVEITCPQHGLFLQRLADHVRGSGCPQCGNQILANRKTLEQF